MFKYHVFALLLATILDYVFGRLYSIWNPFDSIKRLVAHLDRALLGDDIILLEPSKQKGLGMWLCFLVIMPVFILITFFTMLCYDISPVIGIIFEACASYLCIDGNYLYSSARGIMNDFYGDGIEAMGYAVADFTGHETKAEDEAGLTSAAIGHLANEASDSLISPLFIMLLFGPVGGFLYRTIDIIDGCVGHMNSRYQYFGFYAARLNTIVDYLPGRFSGMLTVFAARHTFGGFNGKNAKYIHLRDRNKAISAFAGALGLSLKDGTIGDDDRPAKASDIRAATHLMKNDFLIIQLLLVLLLVFF